ncbi:MAG: 2-octaprenyl-3-methyl-6-methoxy-1,4-benzoquinol hydroxylase [Cycloclasticus sp. symbiont of Poecilosclerida sp. N]|nr:MAG: 2-octaprenyl-3-methyl-6-methoxy-1,4-benzoquinol hydroxylase [Cycloclasticus sp. symbiont of Poecilosclerida sp. N]
MSHDYDVIIIGGGMVGGCLGLALSQSRLRVAIVEACEFSAKQSDSAGKRAIALSWGSRCIFEQLDIWRQVNDAAMSIEYIHVSDKGHFGKTRLSAVSQNVEALGYVVEAAQIEAVVIESLTNKAIDYLCPASLVDYVVHQGGADVTINLDGQEKTLSCQLLVAADGGMSKVREKGCFELKEYAYNQQAITGLIKVESDDYSVAYERFTSEGPIAMLPHFDGLYSLVWTMSTALAEQVIKLSNDGFSQRLQSRFGQWLGELSLSGECQAFPLNLSYTPNNTADRVVLIGNAAHQLHPVAGQSFNLGLRDAAILADTLMSHESFNVEHILDTYVQRRKTDQMLIIGFTDNVIKLFSTNNALLSVLRNSGLLMLDKAPVLKNQFARQTMGLGSRLARLNVV